MNTKTLMLAVVTALSLGAGSAMAQEGAPSMPTVDYWAAKASPVGTAPAASAVSVNHVQSGSSDDENSPFGVAPTRFDYSDLADPG